MFVSIEACVGIMFIWNERTPRKLLCTEEIKELEGLFVHTQVKEALNLVLNQEKGDNDTIDQVCTIAIWAGYYGAVNRHYLLPWGVYRTKSNGIFERDLYNNETGEHLPWLNEEEWLQKYRAKRNSFKRLVCMIQDHPVFNSECPTNKKQAPVSHQLMVLLHYLGMQGSSASNPRSHNVLRIGRGTSELYRNWCIIAIWSLREQEICIHSFLLEIW